MKYQNVVEGVFLKRPNRFVAHVCMDGQEEMVHVKNTGRCKELLLPSARVILEESQNPNRKTRYSLIAVYKGDRLINMDSQAPNAVAAEALERGNIGEIGRVSFIKREVRFGNSRFDLYYEEGERKGFIEVKGVTLEKDGIASFPDAPTQRGSKHLRELMQAAREGYEATVLFVVQMEGIECFRPNWENDKAFADTLQEAATQGVQVLVYGCHVNPDALTLHRRISF